MTTLFLAPASHDVSLASASSAVVAALTKAGISASLFKPISVHDDTASVSLERIEHLLALGELEQIMEDVVTLFQKAAEGVDIVVTEGLTHDTTRLFSTALNLKLARNLSARTILVASGAGTPQEIARQIEHSAQASAAEHGQAIGYILTGVPADTSATALAAEIQQAGKLLPKKPLPLLGVISGDTADIDAEALKAASAPAGEQLMPPPVFRYKLMEKARAAGKRIVLPEGDEPRTIRAAAICQEKGIANCVLVGTRSEIERVAAEQGVTLPAGIEIIDPADVRDRYVAPMVEMRKSKGLTPEDAAKQLEDTVVLGTVMLALDEVDGLVSGAVHTTANTIRPALQLIKTAPGSKMVSSVFFMLMPDQVFVYGDCAVNPNPTAEELAEIAIQSADSAAAFGIPPRVAMISYSTGSSGGGPDVEKVTDATRIAQEKRPDLAIDGPLQYDAASVESVGRQKAPNSKVAGRATVFVFPDLNTGNTTYKAVQRSAEVISVGPMLQGLRKPVNDLSRGALVDDIVYTIALTAIQAVKA